jgi:hypothetical protein
VLDPIGTKFDRVIGQWSDNQISRTDAEKARLAYGAGKTVYVSTTVSNTGSGTLDNPYASLVEARRHRDASDRFIIVALDGSWSVAP